MLIKTQKKRANSVEIQKAMIEQEFDKMTIETKISKKVACLIVIQYSKNFSFLKLKLNLK